MHEREDLKQVTKSSERQEQSLTQAEIDSLRQGQRLDAIDQKPKHDSSKTEVTLDAVMQETEGERGNQEPQPKQKLPLKCISPHTCNSPKMMHSQSQNQTSLPLVRSLLPKILPLVGTCTHLSLNKPKAPPVAET